MTDEEYYGGTDLLSFDESIEHFKQYLVSEEGRKQIEDHKMADGKSVVAVLTWTTTKPSSAILIVNEESDGMAVTWLDHTFKFNPHAVILEGEERWLIQPEEKTPETPCQ